ncbi:hypothetical protein [Nitratifractor sp.]
MKRWIMALTFVLICISLLEGGEWKIGIGDAGRDVNKGVFCTSKDGKMVVAGSLQAFSKKFFVMKLETNGTILWQKNYEDNGDIGYLEIRTIRPTRDGGYILAGSIGNPQQDYRSDILILKLDRSGGIVWQKRYGTDGSDSVGNIEPTKEGGYIVSGTLIEHVTEQSGEEYDVQTLLVMKLDRQGRIEWKKNYLHIRDDGEIENAAGRLVRETRDGGYIVAGGFGWNGRAWIFKFGSGGALEWQKEYNNLYDNAWVRDILELRDGGFLFGGRIHVEGVSGDDYWLVRLEKNGAIRWQKRYDLPGSLESTALALRQSQDGGYLLFGVNESWGKAYHSWLFKVNRRGKLQWIRQLDGLTASSVLEKTKEGGYIFGGLESVGNGRFSLVKTDKIGKIGGCASIKDINTGTVETASIEGTVVTGAVQKDIVKVDVNRTWIKESENTITLYTYTDCYSDFRLLSPNGGILSAGLPKILRWSANFSGEYETLPSSFDLKYSLDKGRHWKKIAAGLDNDTRRYRWRVPAQWHDLPRRALVRVDAFDDLDRLVSDRSDRPLTLRIAKLLAPNKRVTLKSGEKYTIRWHIGAKGKIGKMILQLSTDNGKHWKRIKIVAKPKVRSWRWTVPHTPSNRCRIRVIVKNAKGKTIGVDVSDRTFRIE